MSPTTSNLSPGRFYRRRERRAAVSRRLLRTPSFTSSTDERGDGDRRCQPSSLAAENLVTAIMEWNSADLSFDRPLLDEFLNKFGTAGQAVAVRVAGDNAAFYGCVIKSYQDTLLDDDGNHYFKNCYIEGATDFICGNASSLYEVTRFYIINSI
uniref:pectinesterase n=1 Tax=Brassica oleracea var. oleracea TaxID=109376 RepID=A0A0D3C108_BRAOL